MIGPAFSLIHMAWASKQGAPIFAHDFGLGNGAARRRRARPTQPTERGSRGKPAPDNFAAVQHVKHDPGSGSEPG